MSKSENTIEYLEKLKHFADISNIDEFFRHMQGHTKELSLICSVFDIDYQENINLAIQALQQQSQNKQPCNTCRHYNISKKLYTDECQFCRRYYADQYEPKDN